MQKKSQKHEEFFVEVTCGARSLRTNCFKVIDAMRWQRACSTPDVAMCNASLQLDDPGSVDVTTLSEAHIDFGDDGAPIATRSFASSVLTVFLFSHIVFPGHSSHRHSYLDELTSRCAVLGMLVPRRTA